MMFQICGTAGLKEDIKTEVPWDLYILPDCLGHCGDRLWEGLKHCCQPREVRINALRVKAAESEAKHKLTRNELKELQNLMTINPQDLGEHQKVRLVELKDLFERTMPMNTSRCLQFVRRHTASTPLGSTSSTSSTFNKQPKATKKSTVDQGVQTDLPVFSVSNLSPLHP